ncbi:unnamed protein product [Candidula unifasciata]|uniref:3-keto-steroid reductase/17-beta-hydroxysteroid dehydrogenase 7 n=1 Tax=Candidula unifasciata TaxID=100452 RepID=A0A8S3Z4A9_9EUPU|nr:unnamed protein product [Candidula unifasciata]
MHSMSRRKVAIITGGNSGIGYALAERLLADHDNIRLCLACRSRERAEKAAAKLQKLSADAEISIVILDTSNVQSVYSAARDIEQRYDHIDWLYLNAGMLKVKGVDWSNFWEGLFSKRVLFMFTTGEGLLIQEDGVTDDGLQKVFQTNVFGHYVLIKELEAKLGNMSGNGEAVSQLIWTSSSASLEYNFDIEDFQHKKGKDPYSSSKYATDVLSVGLNNRMNKQNVYSHVMCPGLVMSNLTYEILPQWFWVLVLPFLWLMRLCVPTMTNSASNGSEALVWLSHQDPSQLDPQSKFQSSVTACGKPYVETTKMNIDHNKVETLMQKLDSLDADLRKKYKNA